MKHTKWIYLLFMFLPLLVTAAAIGFLPDQIPAHYNFAGQADRWGSKYESLLFPAATIAMGIFMLLMSRIAARQEPNGRSNERVCLITGAVLLLFFNILNFYSLYTSFTKTENLSELSLDFGQIVCLMLGVSMIIIGNVMPKLKKNSVIGLRTAWSMKNDKVWKRCQRFGGISFIVSGILIIAAGLLIHGIASEMCLLGILIADTAVCVVYSYRAAQDE